MKKFILFYLAVICFCFFLNGENKWKIEAEDKIVHFQKGVKVIDATDASGGKVLEVPSENIASWNVVHFSFPYIGKEGKYRLKIVYRFENAADIGKGWRIDVREKNILENYGVIYGYLSKNNKNYSVYSLDFLWKDSKAKPSFYMKWSGKEGKPVLYIDYFEIERIDNLPEMDIKEVFPDKIRYLPGEKGKVKITVENLSENLTEGKIKVYLISGIDNKKEIAETIIKIAGKSEKTIVFPFRVKELYGHSVKVSLWVNDKKIDEKKEFFTVHKNPWAIAVPGVRDEAIKNYYPIWHHVFYNIGATDPLIEECALNAKKEYTTCTEFFSWSPGEPFYMAPEEPIWIRGNGGNLLRSKREIQKEVSELKKYGIGCISYIAQQAMGKKTVQILQEKPYWFSYSSSGDIIEFYRVSEIAKQNQFWKNFDWDAYKKYGDPSSPLWKNTEESWKKYVEFWKPYREQVRAMSTIGYFVPNYKLQEVVDYVASQVILSAKMFGWDGIRWDCGNLNTGPVWGSYSPWYDFYGNPIAKTREEMQQQTVKNLRRLKKKVRKYFPDFVFGTNFGSWEETHRYPDIAEEFCKDGGWLLDEVSYSYNRPTSPYNKWDKYYEIMCKQGEYVRSRGGHYNPFAFNRGGGKYPVDRIYETIFKIVGKGHPNTMYYNSQVNCGNFAQFLVRFGEFTFGDGLRNVEEPEKIIKITPAKLWWKKSVNILKKRKKEYLIINLINPPIAKLVESDPMSKLPSPVRNVEVTVKNIWKQNVKIYALTCEPWEDGQKPQTEYIEIKGKVDKEKIQFTVPEIFYWKMIVIKKI